MLTNLDIVTKVDSVGYAGNGRAGAEGSEGWLDFVAHDGTTIGRILPVVARELVAFPDAVKVENQRVTVLGKTVEERSQAMAAIASKWREQAKFEVLRGWRNELYTVYNPTHTAYLYIERAASYLFGVVTYGVHITGYVPSSDPLDAGNMKLWVPRRSFTKQTCPGMLDNTIAGGIGYPHGVWETAVKESYEEAGLNEEYVKKRLRPAGVISYYHQLENTLDSETGVFQPEVEYIYDLVMEQGDKPRPVDGEVAEFYSMTVDEVKRELAEGHFKNNCGLIIIDFFIRHGILTSDNEPDYHEIVMRCHRRLEYPVM